MADTNSKPEPIRISVQGVEPEPITMGASGPTEIRLVIDWHKLSGLPTFQTFMSELCKMPFDTVDDWLELQTMSMIQQHGELPCFDMYAKWHSEKPYWKNETPWGELRSEADTN